MIAAPAQAVPGPGTGGTGRTPGEEETQFSIPVKKDSSIPSDIHQRPFMRLQ